MSGYWVKTPKWLPRLFPKQLIWRMPEEAVPAVYLTFDDGPHPEATVFALDELRKWNARATFFCIGKNVTAYPGIYERMRSEGHAAGNHTYDHLNGWKTDNHTYLQNLAKAGRVIDSRLFRPPYGRIRISQARRLLNARPPWRIVMWDVLSGDFDPELSPEACLEHVLTNIAPGSIVVFHDSAKAFPRMRYALPEVLKYCNEKGWQLKALPQ